MPDNPKQSTGEQGPAKDRVYQSAAGQEEFMRFMSELLERVKQVGPRTVVVSDPKVLEAVESLKVTTRRLAKPDQRQPLAPESKWSLPLLNEAPSSGSRKY